MNITHIVMMKLLTGATEVAAVVTLSFGKRAATPDRGLVAATPDRGLVAETPTRGLKVELLN